MNPEIKAAWVLALRSGEFKQGRGHLSKGDKYCCLGVLCELAVKAGVVHRRLPARQPGQHEPQPIWYGLGSSNLLASDWSNTILPVAVRAWADLDRPSPRVALPDAVLRRSSWYLPGETADLAHLNDTDRASFAEIADAIEVSL